MVGILPFLMGSTRIPLSQHAELVRFQTPMGKDRHRQEISTGKSLHLVRKTVCKLVGSFIVIVNIC